MRASPVEDMKAASERCIAYILIKCTIWLRGGWRLMQGKGRCRMHGGTNPGAPKGNRNARKHGGYSAKSKAALAYLKAIAKIVRNCDL
ncbi:MAG: hypothetical protein IPO50_12555 [Sphingomonadales bacterium]|nr:hypothetical protein [Sphingomonadales bacterium]